MNSRRFHGMNSRRFHSGMNTTMRPAVDPCGHTIPVNTAKLSAANAVNATAAPRVGFDWVSRYVTTYGTYENAVIPIRNAKPPASIPSGLNASSTAPMPTRNAIPACVGIKNLLELFIARILHRSRPSPARVRLRYRNRERVESAIGWCCRVNSNRQNRTALESPKMKKETLGFSAQFHR